MTLRAFFFSIYLCCFSCSLFSAENEQLIGNEYDKVVKPKQISAIPSIEASPGVDERLAKYIHYQPDGKNTIGRIVIDDRSSGISQSTWIYVKSAIDYYKEKKPIFVILELNTPGGEVFVAQKISDALKNLDSQEDIPVVAFINNWAISAGAMLAYSCRFITLVSDASMGAAEPVIQTKEGLTAASEKVNSAIRADFANRARFFGRDPLLAEAMVDKDMILVLRHNEIVHLDTEDQIRRKEPDPDIVISPKGKLMTLDAQEMMKYGVGDILVGPKKLNPITKKEKEEGRWPAGKELLFQYPFFQNIPQAEIDEYQMDWKTRFFTLLAHPVVTSILFLGLMFGIYIEISSPGFGVPATIAITCLFLLILSSFALEAIGWLEVILFFAGLAIVLIDLFFVPTFGLLGVVGIIFMIIGLLGMMLPGIESLDFDFDTKTFNAAGEFVIKRFAWFSATLLIGIIGIAILARYALPKFHPFTRFVLRGNEQDASRGYIAGESAKNLPQPGVKGEVLATLRPAGKVMIDNQVFDAVTSGEFIERGTLIEVAYLDGSVIVVKRREQT